MDLPTCDIMDTENHPDDNSSQEYDNNNSTQKKRKITRDFQVISRSREEMEVLLTESTFQTPSSSSVVRNFASEKVFSQPFLNSSIFDGKYFKIIELVRVYCVEVSCQLCLPTQTIIRGFLDTEFVDHLKQIHPTEWDAYTKCKIEIDEETEFSENASTLSSELQQTVLSHRESITQDEFNKRIINFIINTFSPVSIICHPSFKALFEGFNVNVVDYKSAMNTIQATFNSHQNELKLQLSQLKYLCSTVHIWRSKCHNYMVLTLHWLNDTFQRVSVALAFQRFNGPQKVEKMLECIYAKYGIKTTQIISTVTYNVIDLKVLPFPEFILFKPKIDKLSGGNFTLFNMSDYDSAAKDGSTVMLPKYVSCVSETLDLIASVDCINIISKLIVSPNFKNTMAMCRNLYNKAKKPGTTEIIIEVLGHPLSCSSETGWKFYFEAISQLLHEDTKPKLDALNQKLLLPDFTESELEFMQLYWQLMKPLNNALNILQGETSTYFGFLLPTLIGLAHQWKNMKINFRTYKYFKKDQILDKYLETLFKTFAPVFELKSEDAIIAAVACPKFKLRWFSTLLNLKEQTMTIDCIKRVVISTAERLLNSENSDELEYERDTTEEVLDDYFDFMNDANNAPDPFTLQLQTKASQEQVKRKVELELLCYLEDRRTNWKMLEDYPIMKEIFMKFNTGLSSSVSVQRLFSFETTLHSSCCHGLTEENFEKIVLLNTNKIEL